MEYLSLNDIKIELLKIRDGEIVHTEFTQVQVLTKCVLDFIDYLSENYNLA